MSEKGESNENYYDPVRAKHEIKLSGKVLAHKIENLQKDRKRHVNKIKELIPVMKDLMKRNESAPQVKTKLQTLTQLYDFAVVSHDSLILLLPEDEKTVQNGRFSSIKSYTSAFKVNVTRWLNECEMNLNPVEIMSTFVTNDCVATNVPQMSNASQENVCQVQAGTVHVQIYRVMCNRVTVYQMC